MVGRTSELHYFPLVLKSETGFHETTRLTSNVESSCLTLPGSWDLYVRHSQRRLEHRIHFESWKAKGQAWQQKAERKPHHRRNEHQDQRLGHQALCNGSRGRLKDQQISKGRTFHCWNPARFKPVEWLQVYSRQTQKQVFWTAAPGIERSSKGKLSIEPSAVHRPGRSSARL